MDIFVQPISNALDIPIDQCRLVVCLLAAYPAAMVHRQMSDVNLKHWFSFLVGFYFVYYNHDFETIHPLITALGSYVIAATFPRYLVGTATFLYCMTYLCLINLYIMFYYYLVPRIDITACQMIILLKMTSFAFDYSNTIVRPNKIKENTPMELPPLNSFLGFSFFFSTVLTGPPFSFKHYIKFTNRYYKENLPLSFIPAMKKLCIGLFFVPITILSKDLPFTMLLTEPYLSMNFAVRMALMYVIIFFFRTKYYFAWFVAEGSANLAGLGYNGEDEVTKKPKWDRITNVDFFNLEFPQNITMINAAWNRGTTKWLKRYIYGGLAATPGKPAGMYNTMITYLTSSLWHGFYPGYYMFFTYGALITELSKDVRRTVRPYFLGSRGLKLLYDVISVITTIVALHYGAIAFVVLDVWTTIEIWNSFYWSLHIFTILGLFYFRVIHRVLFKPQHKKKH